MSMIGLILPIAVLGTVTVCDSIDCCKTSLKVLCLGPAYARSTRKDASVDATEVLSS